jgi:hypothetical protein
VPKSARSTPVTASLNVAVNVTVVAFVSWVEGVVRTIDTIVGRAVSIV